MIMTTMMMMTDQPASSHPRKRDVSKLSRCVITRTVPITVTNPATIQRGARVNTPRAILREKQVRD